MRDIAHRGDGERYWVNASYRSAFPELKNPATEWLGGTQALFCTWGPDVVQLGKSQKRFVPALRSLYEGAGSGELGSVYEGGQEVVDVPEEFIWVATGVLEGYIPSNRLNDPVVQRALQARHTIRGKNEQVTWAWRRGLGQYFAPTALFTQAEPWDGQSTLVAHGSGTIIADDAAVFGKKSYETGGTHEGVIGPLRTRIQREGANRRLQEFGEPYQFQKMVEGIGAPITWSPHFLNLPGVTDESNLYLGTSRLLVDAAKNAHCGNVVILGGPQDFLGHLWFPVGRALAFIEGLIGPFGGDIIADPDLVQLLDEHCTVEVLDDAVVVRAADGRIILVLVGIEVNDRWNGGTAPCIITRRLGHTTGYSRFCNIPGDPEQLCNELLNRGLAPRGYGLPGVVPVVTGEQTLNGSCSLMAVGWDPTDQAEGERMWMDAVRACGGTFADAI